MRWLRAADKPCSFVRAPARTRRYQPHMAAFETSMTIRFEDADPAGIVFYPRAIALAHSVVEDLIRETELGWEGWFGSRDLAVPVRHAEADFLQPMHPGEKLQARAWVEKCGDTSVTFVVEIADGKCGLCARIRTVHVLVDRKTKQPIPLTSELRRALEPFKA